MQVKLEAKIYEKKNKSGSVSYRVDLGLVNGKRSQKTFSSFEAAETFKRKADEKIRLQNPLALSDLSKAMRYEVLGAVEKLKPYGATLNQAVDFFLKHAKPPKPAITIKEAVDQFLLIKGKAGLSQRYLGSAEDYFDSLRKHFNNCLVTEIDFKQAESYVYNRKHEWNPTTRANHLRHALLLFNFLVERGYISEGLNPFAKVPKPKQIENAVSFLSVEDVTALLQYALDHQKKAECACMVLVFFCGVRVEESAKLTWERVNFEQQRVEITAAIAKKGKRRSNEIPKNALSWLNLCKSTGKVAPDNFTNRMRQVRQEAGIDYQQNAMRHSFASYHVAAFKNAPETAFLLGHPNANLLYNTYRDVVHEAEAKEYWNIVPKAEKTKREQKIDRIRQRFSRAS